MHDIMMNIQDESDFYQAWENMFRDEVPDYQSSEDGERYTASISTWLSYLPETLTFQMQRSRYVNTNKTVKE